MSRPERDRSRSPRGERRSARRSRSPSRPTFTLASLGVGEISEEDYFLKSNEFKRWLRDDREKYLDELSSDAAHKYFRKFVRRWNACDLEQQYYEPQSGIVPASSNTAYKWAFASNRSRVDPEQIAAARLDVGRMTHSGKGKGSVDTGLSQQGRSVGPSMPSTADRQMALEIERDARSATRLAERKSAFARADEMAPKSGGREGQLEERKATNATNREFRERDSAAGLEIPEKTLLGGGSDFASAIAARDQAAARRQERRAAQQQDQRNATNERLSGMRSKESETMEMFKRMAKERYG